MPETYFAICFNIFLITKTYIFKKRRYFEHKRDVTLIDDHLKHFQCHETILEDWCQCGTKSSNLFYKDIGSQ